MTIKIIHYCWFGKNSLPDAAKLCMESWRKFCPDYKIIEWNESNFDVNCCDYVREAYQAKKWAFVSDYCRFWVLYNYGGIYLDTDVELIKLIDNLPDTFVGFENETTCNSGLIRGALPNDEICRLMLESYHNDKFIKVNGELNLKTVCERETSILKKFGLQANGSFQLIAGTQIYPVDFFNPKNFLTGELHITKNTYSIHHYDASWYSEKELYAIKIKRKLIKFLPKKIAGKTGAFIAECKYDGVKQAIKKVFGRKNK